jgi:hypothetical protein
LAFPAGKDSLGSKCQFFCVHALAAFNSLMIRPTFVLLSALLAGCTSVPGLVGIQQAGKSPEVNVPQFSSNPAEGLPKGWAPLVILKNKNATEYRLVSDDKGTVLHARAVRASSALMHEISLDALQQSWISWEWKIPHLLEAANNLHRATDDSPVRIVLGFDGNKGDLPFADQILFETAKLLTGHDFPYATLMYIWENQAPVGTIIPSQHSSRIKMLVAASGSDGVGHWQRFDRNIVEDFKAAFGEEPGRLLGVGVLTDTDNTGETVEAWYGDIRLQRNPPVRGHESSSADTSLPASPNTSPRVAADRH